MLEEEVELDLIKLASQEGSLRRHWAFTNPESTSYSSRNLRQPPQKNYFKSSTKAVQSDFDDDLPSIDVYSNHEATSGYM